MTEEISRIRNSSFAIVSALNEGKIDQETAFLVLDNLRNSAVNFFNKKCELYDSNNLDYSNIDNAKREFLESLDNAVYSVTKRELPIDKETENQISSLLS